MYRGSRLFAANASKIKKMKFSTGSSQEKSGAGAIQTYLYFTGLLTVIAATGGGATGFTLGLLAAFSLNEEERKKLGLYEAKKATTSMGKLANVAEERVINGAGLVIGSTLYGAWEGAKVGSLPVSYPLGKLYEAFCGEEINSQSIDTDDSSNKPRA